MRCQSHVGTVLRPFNCLFEKPGAFAQNRQRGCGHARFLTSRAGLGQIRAITIHDFSFYFYWQIRKFVENIRKIDKIMRPILLDS
jgi:hypothetical protein